jgi:PilZ domain-containing protein
MTDVSQPRRENLGGPAARTHEPEVRRFERIPVSLSAIVKTSQFRGMTIRGVVRYMAAGGLMVELPVEVVSGSIVHVLLQTRQGPQEVEGKVVLTAVSKGKVRHGLAFPEPQGPDFLEEFFRTETGEGFTRESGFPGQAD